ncbi:sensor histidine kinase [Pseudoduganella ginsengisoli]|nr:histidine kinase [Pseudoduganella ginsengisoli]
MMELKQGAATPGCGPALARIVQASWKERGTSLVQALAVCAIAWYAGRPGWLCLFAAFLAVCLCGVGALALVRWLGHGKAQWLWAWLALAAGLLAGACAGYAVARGLAHQLDIVTVDGARLFGSLLAFGLLVLALPLAYAQRQHRALHLLHLEQAALAAELKSLQAQVEPHFLYNTLANTRYLARHDPPQAVRMLDHLIAYLRTSLPDLRTPMSTLGREFELAEHYLALMRIRFGERLVLDVACSEALQCAPVPPLMLMSLVENAVRHGVEPKPGEVTVRVSAMAAGGCLVMTVADNGAGLADTVLGNGVGLRNVRQRLAALYGGSASVALRVTERGWTESVLVLPFDGVLP